jgi:hypothetical protein
MYLRAQPIGLVHRLLGDVSCLLFCDTKQLLHPASEAGEVSMGCSSIGFIEGLAKLMVIS